MTASMLPLHRAHSIAQLDCLRLRTDIPQFVLGVFVAAISASCKGVMVLCRFRYTHRIVAGLMFVIVLRAKGMFYL